MGLGWSRWFRIAIPWLLVLSVRIPTGVVGTWGEDGKVRRKQSNGNVVSVKNAHNMRVRYILGIYDKVFKGWMWLQKEMRFGIRVG